MNKKSFISAIFLSLVFLITFKNISYASYDPEGGYYQVSKRDHLIFNYPLKINDVIKITYYHEGNYSSEDLNINGAFIDMSYYQRNGIDDVTIFTTQPMIDYNKSQIDIFSNSDGTVQTNVYDVYVNNTLVWDGTTGKTVIDTDPPGEVTDITATPSNTSINLSWSNPTDDDFDHVIIYRDDTPIAQLTSHEFTDSSLDEGTQYKYRIVTIDHLGNASNGVTITATTLNTSPPQISNAVISKNSNGDYELTWDSDGEGQVDIMINGIKWGSVDANSKKITIPKVDVPSTLTGIADVSLTPYSMTGKEGDSIKAYYTDGVQASLSDKINALGIIKTAFSFMGIFSGIILLSLAITYAKPLTVVIKKAIKEVRR